MISLRLFYMFYCGKATLLLFVYYIDREMEGHFGNLSFQKPLAVLMIVTLKKFIRWCFINLFIIISTVDLYFIENDLHAL